MIKNLLYDALYVFINYFIAYIPFWFLRKLLYRMCGMKIGKGSRINMRCYVFEPWHISIGSRTIVNEHGLLDGRGGLTIGDDCSLSMYSIVYTASHRTNSEDFEYYERETLIGNGVWIGARAVILAGAILNDGCIIGAGSVASAKEYDAKGIYVGVPAEKVRERDIEKINALKHSMFFR